MTSTGTRKSSSQHPLPTEEALRAIWRTQHLLPASLHTVDGRSVTILSSGTPNDDGGPDFTGARIKIGNTTFSGDVEVHLIARSWFSHRHHLDPHYNGVILHVVYDPSDIAPRTYTASKRPVPLLNLYSILPSDGEGRSFSVDGAHIPFVHCAPCNNQVAATVIAKWIRTLALERMTAAVWRMEDRLHRLIETEACRTHEPLHIYRANPNETPNPSRTTSLKLLAQPEVWDQLLFEALMEGVGFAKNARPFRTLAEGLPLHVLRAYGLDNLDTQLALMFGTAGLLPSSRGLPDLQSRREARRLRRRWRDVHSSLHRPTMHEAEWLFFRLRPANFPTARLATICHLLPELFDSHRGFSAFVEIVRKRDLRLGMRLREMHSLLALHPSAFWRTHTHFRGKRPVRGIALGVTRKNDIVVNGIIPLLRLWGRLFDEQELDGDAAALLEIIPASRSRIVRIMEDQLIRKRFPIRTALMEQGVLECYHRYCQSKRCDECAVGSEVGRLRVGSMQPASR